MEKSWFQLEEERREREHQQREDLKLREQKRAKRTTKIWCILRPVLIVLFSIGFLAYIVYGFYQAMPHR